MFNVLKEFWQSWFPENFNPELIEYLGIICVLGLIFILLYGFVSIFAGKNNIFKPVIILVFISVTVVYTFSQVDIFKININIPAQNYNIIISTTAEDLPENITPSEDSLEVTTEVSDE